MVLRTVIPIPGSASLDGIEHVLTYLREVGTVAADLADRTIVYSVDTDDLPETGLPPLAEDVVREALKGTADDAIAALRVARTATEHERDVRAKLGALSGSWECGRMYIGTPS